MEEMNIEFNVPYYIFEEIIEYVELTKQGYCKSMKWNNIKALLKLAQVNDRLSIEQVNFIENKYNRE